MTSHFRAIRPQRLISLKFMRHSRMFQKLQDFKNLQKYRKSKKCKKKRKNPKKCNFLIKMSRSELNDQILKKSPWLSGFCSENPNYGDLGFCLMDLRFWQSGSRNISSRSHVWLKFWTARTEPTAGRTLRPSWPSPGDFLRPIRPRFWEFWIIWVRRNRE